jgi:hypothetical protein
MISHAKVNLALKYDINVFLYAIERLSITAIFGLFCSGVRDQGFHGFSLPSSMIPFLLEHRNSCFSCPTDVIDKLMDLVLDLLELLFRDRGECTPSGISAFSLSVFVHQLFYRSISIRT